MSGKLRLVSNPKELVSLFGDTLIKDRIAAFYARMNAALRELEAYKKKNGYCTSGISCMRKRVKGDACAHHAAASKAGMRLRTWKAYQSEYGLLRKAEREENRKREKDKKKKVRK